MLLSLFVLAFFAEFNLQKRMRMLIEKIAEKSVTTLNASADQSSTVNLPSEPDW
jgi:sulfur relay (sulfurtransferase) DsrC/TusE family protein